jgi:hypothetical protein
MKKIAAAKFKERCLSILDRLDPEGVVITKHAIASHVFFPSSVHRPT